MITVATILDYLDQFAPRSLAASWDNVGLLLGDRTAAVQKIMTCLTVTRATAAEAVAEKAQLIVSHHPILFRPVQRLTGDTPEGRLLLSLVQAGVAVCSPHTSFDNTRGGINEIIAGRLGLKDVRPLRLSPAAPQCKIVVFVPEGDLAKVVDAMFSAGAGKIGEYRECSFRLAGTGTFFGSESTSPTVGEKGRREEVSEWRLEVICPQALADPVVAAMRKAHSYEEPAYDVYPLRPGVSPLGEGRVGKLAQPSSLADFAQQVKKSLGSGPVQVVGETDRPVSTIAVACGAGGDLLRDAIRCRADVLRFHDYLSAQAEGLALVLPGHYATEQIGVEVLASLLQRQFPEQKVWASRRERDPVDWVI
jgi:dinuclear metal center YbgI/SA1388 family protein